MSHYTTSVSCTPPTGFRAQQVAGMFDLDLKSACRETFHAEFPALGEPWSIGAIVGPSGSGKSTIAREAFGGSVCRGEPWPADQAVIDALGAAAPPTATIGEITHLLTAVGFSSPPAWVKPYRVLSTGEQFRCDLARALLGPRELVVFDEFTSVVDRSVAKVASAAVSKAIRSGRVAKRLVAVSCHSDMLPWLGPDWKVVMPSGKLDWGRLRRQGLVLRVVRCRQSAWELFARHHYLTASLPRSASCYLCLWDESPVAFCATAGLLGVKGHKRIARLVTLPDYQGIGIGRGLLECVSEAETAAGFRVSITTSHPAMIACCHKSPHWHCTAVKKHGARSRSQCYGLAVKGSWGRGVVAFEYRRRQSAAA